MKKKLVLLLVGALLLLAFSQVATAQTTTPVRVALRENGNVLEFRGHEEDFAEGDVMQIICQIGEETTVIEKALVSDRIEPVGADPINQWLYTTGDLPRCHRFNIASVNGQAVDVAHVSISLVSYWMNIFTNWWEMNPMPTPTPTPEITQVVLDETNWSVSFTVSPAHGQEPEIGVVCKNGSTPTVEWGVEIYYYAYGHFGLPVWPAGCEDGWKFVSEQLFTVVDDSTIWQEEEGWFVASDDFEPFVEPTPTPVPPAPTPPAPTATPWVAKVTLNSVLPDFLALGYLGYTSPQSISGLCLNGTEVVLDWIQISPTYWTSQFGSPHNWPAGCENGWQLVGATEPVVLIDNSPHWRVIDDDIVEADGEFYPTNPTPEPTATRPAPTATATMAPTLSPETTPVSQAHKNFLPLLSN